MWITFIVLGALVVLFGLLILNTRNRMKSLKDVKSSEKVLTLTDQNFSNKVRSGIVLVDFWAEWCMPCKMMIPVLNELSEEVDGSVSIAKLNVDEQKKTAAGFKVRSIPTMILFRNGKEIHRFVGVKTKDYLLKELDRRSKF
ncbi:MAG: thioredoxin [Bacteroidota bacterium]|jgi:thioredoxin 1